MAEITKYMNDWFIETTRQISNLAIQSLNVVIGVLFVIYVLSKINKTSLPFFSNTIVFVNGVLGSIALIWLSKILFGNSYTTLQAIAFVVLGTLIAIDDYRADLKNINKSMRDIDPITRGKKSDLGKEEKEVEKNVIVKLNTNVVDIGEHENVK